MQLREQSHRVQLIRTRYDAALKRNVQVKPLLSFPLYGQPGKEIWSELNEEESQQLRTWLTTRDEASRQRRIASDARQGARRIREVTDAVPQMTPDDAVELWAALDGLRRALVKAGHRRPKKAAAAPTTPSDPGQP